MTVAYPWPPKSLVCPDCRHFLQPNLPRVELRAPLASPNLTEVWFISTPSSTITCGVQGRPGRGAPVRQSLNTQSRFESQLWKAGLQEMRLLCFPCVTPQSWSLVTIHSHSSSRIAWKSLKAHSGPSMRGRPGRKKDLALKGPSLQTTAPRGQCWLSLCPCLSWPPWDQRLRQTQSCFGPSLVWLLLELCVWYCLIVYF